VSGRLEDAVALAGTCHRGGGDAGQSTLLRVSVDRRLTLDLHAQPDDLTCGPTCLHAVYRYHGLDLPLETVIRETPRLNDGGTLAVNLGRHALRYGFKARLYVFNLRIFDPTWFEPAANERHTRVAESGKLVERLRAQRVAKTRPKLRTAIDAYLEYLELGGEVAQEDLTTDLLRRYLNRDIPILTGLSATYLYGSAREIEVSPGKLAFDDILGEPTGHFVILSGYQKEAREVLVADPLSLATASPSDRPQSRHYSVDIHRLLCAILVGIITYDGNLLILTRPP